MDETIFLDVIYCDALVFYAWKNITSWGAYLHELEFNIFENTDIPFEEAGRKNLEQMATYIEEESNFLEMYSATALKFCYTYKQEAHGPHRSPEKTVQINKHIWLYQNVD